MRVRLRYLTCKFHLRLQPGTQQKKTTAFEILRAIKESIQSNFGDFGAAALLGSLQIRYYDEATHIFILRCPREGYRSAWAAMTLVTSLGGNSNSSSSSSGTRASISVLRVSGSVRTCRADAVEILVAAAAKAAAVAGIGQMEEEGEKEEAREAKRAYYQAQIEGAIQGV